MRKNRESIWITSFMTIWHDCALNVNVKKFLKDSSDNFVYDDNSLLITLWTGLLDV